MVKVLIGNDIAHEREARQQLARMHGDSQLEYIQLEQLDVVCRDIDCRGVDEHFFADCVGAFKSATMKGVSIVNELAELEYFCLSTKEYFHFREHPFLRRYLIPVLLDETEGRIQLLAWSSQLLTWHSQHQPVAN